MALGDITGHSKPYAQHHLRPLPEAASFRHLKEVGVESLPFQPMRTRFDHEIGSELREVGRRRCGYEGENQ